MRYTDQPSENKPVAAGNFAAYIHLSIKYQIGTRHKLEHLLSVTRLIILSTTAKPFEGANTAS